MWWPERKPDETADRVEELVDERSTVLRGPNGSGKNAAFRALDDLTPQGETRGAFSAARFYARRIRVRRT
jgi:ABC-type molybdenum transport system ATPase subunit/photorepair protein PhrA